MPIIVNLDVMLARRKMILVLDGRDPAQDGAIHVAAIAIWLVPMPADDYGAAG